MTDRLATLMHSEADALDVPSPPTPEILAAGRRIRRTSTAWRAGAAAAALVVVTGVTVGALQGRGKDEATVPPAATPAVSEGYAVDDTVYVDGGKAATLPEVAQSLYYTSAGILVRTNKDGASDGGAPFHFELVHADGTATKLGVTLGEVVPSTDAAEPYLAWATMTGDTIHVIVHDVATDEDIANVDVPGKFRWGGWEAPPVALSGDFVYVGTDHQTQVVNWRTGETSTTDVVPGSTVPSVMGGRTFLVRHGSITVTDVATGKTLLEIPYGQGAPDLSPDGRYALVSGRDRATIYDVDNGADVSVPAGTWGWSADGDEVFRVHGSTMTTCSAATGDCADSSIPPLGGDATVRYAGQTFES
jgi:hypothetical protein